MIEGLCEHSVKFAGHKRCGKWKYSAFSSPRDLGRSRDQKIM